MAAIPEFRPNGYLPEGVFVCSEGDAIFRFGSGNRRRRQLALRLRRWIELGRKVGVVRLLLDGSFVTTKLQPDDLDAVMQLPSNFRQQLEQGVEAADELEMMLLTRQPEELFAAEDEADWVAWVEFFSRTREADGRRKELVEIRI